MGDPGLIPGHCKDSLLGGSHGLMVRESDSGSSLGPAGIVGGGGECPALSPPSIPRLSALEQGTEPPTATPGAAALLD